MEGRAGDANRLRMTMKTPCTQFRGAGVEHYAFVSVLNSNTSAICIFYQIHNWVCDMNKHDRSRLPVGGMHKRRDYKADHEARFTLEARINKLVAQMERLDSEIEGLRKQGRGLSAGIRNFLQE